MRLFSNQQCSQSQPQNSFIKIQNDSAPNSVILLSRPRRVLQKIYKIKKILVLLYWKCSTDSSNSFLEKLQKFTKQIQIQMSKVKNSQQMVHKIQKYAENEDNQIIVLYQLGKDELVGVGQVLISIFQKKNVRLMIGFDTTMESLKQFQDISHFKKFFVIENCDDIQYIIKDYNHITSFSNWQQKQPTNSLFSIKTRTIEQRFYTNTIYAIINQSDYRKQISAQLKKLLLATRPQKFQQMYLNQFQNRQQLINEFIKDLTDSQPQPQPQPPSHLQATPPFAQPSAPFFSYSNQMSIKKTIFWYTRQLFVYVIVGKIMRYCNQPQQLYYLSPYLRDLYKSIQALYLSHEQSSLKEFFCYRGARMSENQLEYLKKNVGNYAQNRIFLSTSLDYHLHFVTNVLFTIHVVDQKDRQPYPNPGYASLKYYSLYQYENQILFNPLNYFKIKSISQKSQNDLQYYEIQLQYIDMTTFLQKDQKLLTEQERILWEFGIEEFNMRNIYKKQQDAIFGDYDSFYRLQQEFYKNWNFQQKQLKFDQKSQCTNDSSFDFSRILKKSADQSSINQTL